MKKQNKTKKLLFAILIAFAIVSVWRGVWQLSDLYLFPNNYALSNWTSLIVGFVILTVAGYTSKKFL